MNITVRFFASLRDEVGSAQLRFEVSEGADLRDLVEQLVAHYPALDGDEAMWHFAVNQTHADIDTSLEAGDRVAIFPYVAGG